MDISEALAAAGAEALVSAAPADVAWLTGFAVPHESWPSPLQARYAAVADRDGAALVLPELFVELGRVDPAVAVVPYTSYDLAPELRLAGGLADAVAATVAERGLAGRPLLVDAGLPLAVARALEPAPLQAVEDPTAPLRRLKTGAEIERIRAAGRACDRFQRELRELVAPGRGEAELFAAARARVEAAEGGRTTILGDLVSGPRSLAGGGPPGDRRLQAGDAVLCDVAISRDGYWADNCATLAAGAVGPELRRAATAVREALELAIERCRPGVATGELDATVRDFLGDRGYGFGHHLGHGIGASYHESPRIVPGGDETLRPSMVVCLEPAALTGTPAGVRMEVVGVVREDGFECLTEVPELP